MTKYRHNKLINYLDKEILLTEYKTEELIKKVESRKNITINDLCGIIELLKQAHKTILLRGGQNETKNK